MKKNLVIQVQIIKAHEEINSNSTYSYVKDMYRVSRMNAKFYANKCGADYYVVTGNEFDLTKDMHVAYQRLKFYDLSHYNQILYLDSDYIIKDNAPNIFEKYPNMFAACRDVADIAERLAAEIGIPKENYFNSGMMLLTGEMLEKTRNVLEKYLAVDGEYKDQDVLNKMFYEEGFHFYQLNPDLWNPSVKTFGKYADHYAGHTKNLWDPKLYDRAKINE